MAKELKLGDVGPDFSLKDKDAEVHRLKEIDSDYVVLYFYPKDNTPGCTTEATEFNSKLRSFNSVGATVIGISGGDEKSKQKFCDKHGLKILLLSDPDFTVSGRYNSYGEKKFMGRTFDGIHRKTFVLNHDKRIVKIYPKVKAAGHAAEVLEFIKEHRKQHT